MKRDTFCKIRCKIWYYLCQTIWDLYMKYLCYFVSFILRNILRNICYLWYSAVYYFTKYFVWIFFFNISYISQYYTLYFTLQRPRHHFWSCRRNLTVLVNTGRHRDRDDPSTSSCSASLPQLGPRLGLGSASANTPTGRRTGPARRRPGPSDVFGPLGAAPSATVRAVLNRIPLSRLHPRGCDDRNAELSAGPGGVSPPARVRRAVNFNYVEAVVMLNVVHWPCVQSFRIVVHI